MSGSTLDNNSNRPQAKLAIAPKQKALAENLDRHFDFIVCGAGASGSVIAGRLAANPDVKVLLLEAGDSDELELVMDPTLWVRTIGSELDWGFVAARNSQLNGRAIPYSMGKVLGGGSSVNVSTWLRGHQADWDAYAAETGDPAWGYESSLICIAVGSRIGKEAPIPTIAVRAVRCMCSLRPTSTRSSALRSKRRNRTGLKRFENPNGRMMEADSGCAVVDEIVKDGGRQSVFRSYAHPRVGQANLTVLTRTLVTRIVFKGNRAAGVESSLRRASSLRSKRHWRSSFLLRHRNPEAAHAIRHWRSGRTQEVRRSRRGAPAWSGTPPARSRRAGNCLGRYGKAGAAHAQKSSGLFLEHKFGAGRAKLLPLRARRIVHRT